MIKRISSLLTHLILVLSISFSPFYNLSFANVPPTSISNSEIYLQNTDLKVSKSAVTDVAENSKYDLRSYEDFQRNLHHLDLVLSNKSTRHSLDTFRLLDQQRFQTSSVSNSYVNPKSLKIELESDGRLIILNGSEAIHEMHFSAHSAILLGPYIVAVEKEGFIKSNGIQNLIFIDTQFLRSALNHTELPVFRLPILTKEPVTNLILDSTNTQHLILQTKTQNIPLSSEVFKGFSEIQQVAFNMLVNLLDPKTFENASYLLDSLTEYFDQAKNLAGASLLQQATNTQESLDYFTQWTDSLKNNLQIHRDVLKSKENHSSEDFKLKPEDIIQKFQASATFHSTLTQISQNLKASRRMINRLALLTAALSVPRPEDSRIIIKSLAMVGGGLTHLNTNQSQEGFRGLWHHKYFRRGTEVVAAAALAATYPSEFSQFLFQGLDISRQVLEHTLGKATDLAVLGQEALVTTLSGFHPSVLMKTYFTPENLPLFLVGMGSIVTSLYITLGIPHLIVNSYKLYQDLKKFDFPLNKNDTEDPQGFLKRFLSKSRQLKHNFIERENQQEKNYLDLLSKAAQEANPGSQEPLTPEKELELKALLAQIEREDQSWYQKLFRPLTESSLMQRFKGQSNHQIETFAGALRHLIFSYSSLTNAAFIYTKIWNVYFSFRSFVWKPGAWHTLLMYPQYIEKLTARETSVTLPTQLNGAFRRRLQQKALNQMTNKKTILQWEDQIIDLESKVYEASLRRSFRALVQYLKSNETLNSLYKKNGIEKLTDKTLEELNSKEKAFFRLYFDRLFEKSMHHLLSQIIFQNPDIQLSEVELNKLTTLELKQLDIESQSPALFQIPWPDLNLQKTIDELASESLAIEVIKTVDHRWRNASAWSTYFRHQTLKILSPDNNPQTKRLHKVFNQIKKPEAMARAVRSMMATMLIDKPMELAFLFAATAGITSGMMMPLQDQMFSADSWFYLSRYTFWNGYIFGLVTGIMSDVWSKLQKDERLDKKLNKVPEGADAELSYLSYMKKVGFNNPENSWWVNQKFATEIVWAGMKPALVTYMIFNFASLGRFELDAYIAGYTLAFLTPIMGIGYKLENMFESSAGWVARKIPKEYRHYPLVQDYLNQQISRKRIEFNLVYRVYENFLSYLQWNFQLMKTVAFGPRSFLRILFEGYTPTEIVANQLTDFKNHTALSVPAEWLVNKCTSLFTNNYTDGIKLKK